MESGRLLNYNFVILKQKPLLSMASSTKVLMWCTFKRDCFPISCSENIFVIQIRKGKGE